jgi:uncharacterized Zn-binding protein involved in type VI secretion
MAYRGGPGFLFGLRAGAHPRPECATFRVHHRGDRTYLQHPASIALCWCIPCKQTWRREVPQRFRNSAGLRGKPSREILLSMFPAARATDMHVCPMLTVLVPHVGGPILPPCAITVLTGGLPQARVTDMATCVGPPDTIILGSFTVLVCGMPAARMMDMTAHGGMIILGEPTVLIGG